MTPGFCIWLPADYLIPQLWIIIAVVFNAIAKKRMSRSNTMASNSTGINYQISGLTVQTCLKNSNKFQPQIIGIFFVT